MYAGGAEKAEQRASLKECTAWKKEIRELWTAVGEASGERMIGSLKSRMGFGYRVRRARTNPSNTVTHRYGTSCRTTGTQRRCWLF